MMSQESQPRASISSDDMGRKGAGVSLLAQNGLYEKMSRGSPAEAPEGSFEGEGTTLRLPEPGGEVNGILGKGPSKRARGGYSGRWRRGEKSPSGSGEAPSSIISVTALAAATA